MCEVCLIKKKKFQIVDKFDCIYIVVRSGKDQNSGYPKW